MPVVVHCLMVDEFFQLVYTVLPLLMKTEGFVDLFVAAAAAAAAVVVVAV